MTAFFIIKTKAIVPCIIIIDESGLPITKNVLAKIKGECEEKLARLKEGLSDSGKDKCTPSMPFGDWMDYWYRTYCKESLAETTQMTYEERIYKQIIPKIGKTPLNQITTGLLEKFYAHLKADGRLIRREQFGTGLSNAVSRSIHAHCGAALEKAKKEKLIFKNPAEKCKLPPKKSPEVQILRADEMRRLLIQAYEDGFYEMFLLDLSTGIRRGELLALQWSDVDLKKRTIRICKQVKYIKGELKILPPKTKASNRTINIPPQLASVLGEYRERVDSIWLFPSPVKEWVVSLDLSKYFDTLNHELLMNMLREDIKDKVLIDLIKKYLKSGVMENGLLVRTEKGSPQGRNLSPLLANIYLTKFDKEFEGRGVRVIRYADDIVLLAKSRRAAERLLETSTRYLEGKLKLKVNTEKSRAVSVYSIRNFGFSALQWEGTEKEHISEFTQSRREKPRKS